MLLASTKRSLAVATVLFGVVAAGVAGVAYYTIMSGESLRSQSQLIADQAAEQELQVALRTSVEETVVEREAVNQLLLERDDVIGFLATIESFNSPAVSVEVNTIEEADDGPFPYVRIPLSIAGEQASVISVLESLESLPYASYLQQLNISSAATEGFEDVESFGVQVTLVVAIQPII